MSNLALRSLRPFSFALAALLPVFVGCDDSVVVQLQTGPQEFEVSTASLGLPMELRGSDGRIASVPCGPMGACPSSASVPVSCEASMCDPAARTISAPLGGVVDFDELLSEARTLLRRVDAIEVLAGTYTIPTNTLTVDLPETEVWWSPEAALDADPAMGAVLLARVPPVRAGDAVGGDIAVDPAGSAALSDYLVNTDRRVRFWARTRVDLNPGDPFPAGNLRVAVNVTVRVVGSLLR